MLSAKRRGRPPGTARPSRPSDDGCETHAAKPRGRGPGRPPRRPVGGRDQPRATTPPPAAAPVVSPMLFAARAAGSGSGRELGEYLRAFVTLPDDSVLSSLPPPEAKKPAPARPGGAMAAPAEEGPPKSKRDLLAERRAREAAVRQRFAEWVDAAARSACRISQLRRRGMLRGPPPDSCAPSSLPPPLAEPALRPREPPPPRCVWGHVLVDIVDRHREIAAAVRHRRALLRKCARQIEREDEEKNARLGIFKRPEAAQRAERDLQRRLAKWTAHQVFKKWLYVQSVVDEQRQIEEDEMRSHQDKRVLFEILDRSTRLLEGQRKPRRDPDSSMASSSSDEDAAISPEQSDLEFTSESSANDDSDLEMDDLTKDQSVPMESLISQYYEMQQHHSGDDEDSSSEEGDASLGSNSDSGIGQLPTEPLSSSQQQHAIELPFLLRGHLREYQRQGLDWLASLHEHQINGILADEMGLGKTIQTIALLAHLACHRGIWGPHLIIVPTSVLLNWEQELHRWLPGFKVLTYYGSRAERKQKRKGWSKPNALHVCVTSYQLAIQDAAVFRRKPWYYMILDEAQAIKNFRSQRWQTLLGVKSASRLLLTGTPLQNSLIELWSLMYFLMPHEFGSTANDDGGGAGEGRGAEVLGFAGLDRFREWFSQPLEKLLAVRPEIAAPVSRGAGDKVAFNTTSFLQGNHAALPSLELSTQAEAQQAVQKLHTVLRPHILRRLKQDVETQLPDKTEHVVYCHLSKRQRLLYDDFMSRSQTRETLRAGTYLGVMGCLMQLRKVCNHPDLFETRPIVTSWVVSGSSIAEYCRTENLVRRLISVGSARRSGALLRPPPMPWQGCDGETAWRLRGLVITSSETRADAGAWSCAKRLDATPMLLRRGLQQAYEVLELMRASESGAREQNELRSLASRYRRVSEFAEHQHCVLGKRSTDTWMRLAAQNFSRIHGSASKPVYGSSTLLACSVVKSVRERLGQLAADLVLNGEERLERYRDTIENYVFATPSVVVVASTASDREALLPHLRIGGGTADVVAKELMPNIVHVRRRVARHTQVIRPIEQRLQIAFPEPFLLQYDCGKLQALDRLLGRLVREGHRALVFTQMTKVLDILEKWLNLHGYRYLRLDGATKVEQRWRLTERFNHDPRWTVFISSTRAGGLGINLTGADTVIFYDSDWNHAMDAQCQDRCHRIGQQREVHIYRLISERTIEEAIWKKQCQKRWLNQVVIQEGGFDPNAARADRLDRKDDAGDALSNAAAAPSALGVGDWYDLAGAVLAQSNSAATSLTAAAEMNSQQRQRVVSERDAAKILSAAEDEVDAMALHVAIAEVAQADALDMGDEPENDKPEAPVTDMAVDADAQLSNAQEPDDGIGHIDDYMFRFLSDSHL
ncbi:swr1 complex component [Coemansia sp. RSA 2320]|nr:swr1 complex component [Coemansia sp. RSA 2320]